MELIDALKAASKNGKLEVFGEEMAVASTTAIAEIMFNLKSKEERKKLYEGGKIAGYDSIGSGSWVPNILKDLGLKVSMKYNKDDLLRVQEEVTTLFGWGEYRIVKLEDDEVIIHIKNSPIAKYILKKYGKQKFNTCSWLLGNHTGIFSRFLGKDMNGKETKCLAMGDPYCEFMMKQVRK